MAKADTSDRPYVNIDELQEGQTVWLDGCFVCHPPGPVVVHLTEDGGEPYFKCYEGEHYIEGLLDGDNHAVGVYLSDPGPLEWSEKNAYTTKALRAH